MSEGKKFSNMSLVWLITRNNSSTLVKRNGVQFNSEAGNVLNTHSYKNSGLLSDSISVQAVPAQKAVSLTLPGKKRYTLLLKKVDLRKLDKIVARYRPDLAQAVVARVVRIFDSYKTPKAGKVKKIRGRK
jgi:large subunit ribosomal protein L28e